jgi:hypothetical protein
LSGAAVKNSYKGCCDCDLIAALKKQSLSDQEIKNEFT